MNGNDLGDGEASSPKGDDQQAALDEERRVEIADKKKSIEKIRLDKAYVSRKFCTEEIKRLEKEIAELEAHATDTLKPPGGKFDWKGWAEDHPLKTIGSIILVTISLTSGFLVTLHSSVLDSLTTLHRAEKDRLLTRQQIEVAELKSEHLKNVEESDKKFRSLKIRFGEKHIDINKFVLDTVSLSDVSSRAKLFDYESFYAPKDSEHWKFQRVSRREFWKDLFGDDNLLLEQLYPPAELELAGKEIVYVWRGSQESELTGANPFRSIFPYITVEFVHHSRLKDFMPAEDEGVLRDAFETNLMGLMLIEQLRVAFVYSRFSKSMKVIMRTAYTSLAKTSENYLYLSFLFKLSDVEIDGQAYGKYYFIHEVILISTPNGIYNINFRLPNNYAAPRPEHRAWINRWIADFGIFIEE